MCVPTFQGSIEKLVTIRVSAEQPLKRLSISPQMLHVGVPGKVEAHRLAAGALHLSTSFITLSMRAKPTSVTSSSILSQHPCPDVPTGSHTPPALIQGSHRAMDTPLQLLRADSAFITVYCFRMGKAGTPN